jgi:hypothetical protein
LINGVCVKKQKSIWMAPVVGRSRESLHALVFFKVPCAFCMHLYFFMSHVRSPLMGSSIFI